jgi:hypothetical protein
MSGLRSGAGRPGFAATVAEAGNESYIGPTRFIQSSGPPGLTKLPEAAFDAALRRTESPIQLSSSAF